jgi:hypothetical protein
MSPTVKDNNNLDILGYLRNSQSYSFLPRKRNSNPDINRGMTLDRLNSICQVSQRMIYDICKNNQHVANISLFSTVFKLGDVITVNFNFSDSELRCFHLSIYLEKIETVSKQFSNLIKPEVSHVFAEHHEYCANNKKSNTTLCIPAMSSPEFSFSIGNLYSYLASVKWHLRVEFITEIKKKNNNFIKQIPTIEPKRINCKEEKVEKSCAIYKAQSQVLVEPFECIIPIKVLPTDWVTGSMFKHRCTYSLGRKK